MRVIIFSWEFPPRVVGEISYYVERLASGLAGRGVGVSVVTFHEPWTGAQRRGDGVEVYRVMNPVSTHINILTWTATLTAEFERAASDIYYAHGGDVGLVDANEWMCIPTAATLKRSLDIPFVYTVHSLENHRSHGGDLPLNLSIKSLEWLGCYEAERVIVKSDWMRSELQRVYKVPPGKARVVAPGSPDWLDGVLNVYREGWLERIPKVCGEDRTSEASSLPGGVEGGRPGLE